MNALEFRDVSFSYPATDTEPNPAPVLEHVSLAVPEGAFALLTGSTGSGKSTPCQAGGVAYRYARR